MAEALFERLLGGSDDVPRRIEIRLADFEVNDGLALRFECARLDEHLEGGFLSNVVHPLGRRDHVVRLPERRTGRLSSPRTNERTPGSEVHLAERAAGAPGVVRDRSRGPPGDGPGDVHAGTRAGRSVSGLPGWRVPRCRRYAAASG